MQAEMAETQAPEQHAIVSEESPAQEDPTAIAARLPGWKLALILASSALLSGTALVLWNRGALQRLRQPEAPTFVDRDTEFI